MAAAAPVLDARTTEDFLGQALALARVYCPDWSAGWPTPIDQLAVDADPGLAMLNLFALLGRYLGDVENRIPDQRRLAFYSFLGLMLRPPVAARAPLVFRLRDDRPPRAVPARTAVLDAPTQAVRFETTDDLLVLPATLAAAVTLIPAQDQMIDVLPRLGSDDPVCAFGGTLSDPAVRQIGHWFLIGDPALFTPDSATRRLTLTLTGRNLHPAYFDQWFDGDLTPLRARTSVSADGLSLSIELIDMPAAKPMTVGDLQQALDRADNGPSVAPDALADDAKLGWLVVKPAPAIRIVGALKRQVPVITGLTCVASGDAAPVQQAVTGTAPWTIGNGGYPFGRTPAVNDAFYLRADDVLAKAGAQIVLSFDLQPPSARRDASIEWQYWDGKGWAAFNATSVDVSLHQFADTTDALQGDTRVVPAEIAFVCPTIPLTAVAGITGRWIRAVLTAGGYGTPGGYTTDPVDATIARVPSDILTDDEKRKLTTYLTQTARIGFGVRFDAGSQTPPFVRGVRIGYRRTATPQRYWTYNALSLTRFLFRPYRPVENQATALYLGFEPKGFVAHAAGKALTLLVHLIDDPAADTTTAPCWHALDGDGWEPLVVDDGTHALSRSGIVRLVVPQGIVPTSLFSAAAPTSRGRTIATPISRPAIYSSGSKPTPASSSSRPTCSPRSTRRSSAGSALSSTFRFRGWTNGRRSGARPFRRRRRWRTTSTIICSPNAPR
ncbi:hypothetical protein ASE86_11285 [Sphingomonas sp. Leaf33]|uniref:hypothetical protein n=1 Tax=Sphingomonas sp. Leaf33 TaxID=1736215 RepID=UPI0006F33489|nr:hypothetical protein [Sphingomonas sp. Leaf33]KQN26648.1 hypothetical protein ASE86_11285 [Sphingomonas sp. Leaf33]